MKKKRIVVLCKKHDKMKKNTDNTEYVWCMVCGLFNENCYHDGPDFEIQ